MKRICYVAALVVLFFACGVMTRASAGEREPVRAIYLGPPTISLDRQSQIINNLIKGTEVNAVVLDTKVGREFLDDRHKAVIRRFRENGIFVVCRMVIFQDSHYAGLHPKLAIKRRDGNFWWSGKKKWKRYWIDPAAEIFWAHNIDIALRSIEAGCGELNFDYIRFPSDGDMKNMVYPYWSSQVSKYDVLEKFFAKLSDRIRTHYPDVPISADIFGYVHINGAEEGVGQRLISMAKYFDIIAPMLYPSHFGCGAFGFADPNSHPYTVYRESLIKGSSILTKAGLAKETRPWLQGFSIVNIYGCGKRVEYSPDVFKKQIEALDAMGIKSWMVWNPRFDYPAGYFESRGRE